MQSALLLRQVCNRVSHVPLAHFNQQRALSPANSVQIIVLHQNRVQEVLGIVQVSLQSSDFVAATTF